MSSNKLNSDNSNVVTIQIDFCFLKQNFSSLIRTQIEFINGQILGDVNWFNKAIWKSALIKVIRSVLLYELSF